MVYNGTKDLGDTFSTFELDHSGIKIRVKVKIVDIHYNTLEDTHTDNALAGYAYFYQVYDENIRNQKPPHEAFDIARKECIKNGYLQGFIEKEGFTMFYKDILDYDTQLKAEGKAEGLLEAAKRLLLKGVEPQSVAEMLQLTDAELNQLKNAMA